MNLEILHLQISPHDQLQTTSIWGCSLKKYLCIAMTELIFHDLGVIGLSPYLCKRAWITYLPECCADSETYVERKRDILHLILFTDRSGLQVFK